MNQYEYINNNDYQEKIFYENNKIKEEINKSNNLSQLEQDILIHINYLRTNPLDFCNNLIRKNQYNQNKDYIEIINYIEDIHQKQTLSKYIEMPEISSAARNLLNCISIHYKKYHNYNFKEFEPTSLNLRSRLSNYGERTGRLFETVLFQLDNPDDIVSHVLNEEKGRNMLLNYKMKYIGIACDILPSNCLCTVIDIVQDFKPFKNKKNNNDISNDINSVNMTNNNSAINNPNSSFKSEILQKKNIYNLGNNEYISLINDLNKKNCKENLKLQIKKPENKIKTKDIEIGLNINDIKKEENINNLNKLSDNQKGNYQRINYYKSPIIKSQMKYQNKDILQDNPNNEGINIIRPKRNNSNNINIIKKDLNNNNIEDIENINNIKFTMAGRSFQQQQEIIKQSTIKNINKSKSVCSFDIKTNYSKANKNKYQRLNHKEKMEILRKINHKSKKNHNSQVSDKNSENGIIPNIINNNNDNIHKSNNFDINFENKSKKSQSQSTYNQEYYDIISETDKNIINNINNKYMAKEQINSNIMYDDGINQTFTDLRSNQDVANNEDYSRNKINEIKNDLIHFKNQIKKELKEEVRQDRKNEFNKKLLLENKLNNKSNIIFNNYNEQQPRRSSFKNNNEINDNIYYNQIYNNSNNNYIYQNKGKNRCSSVETFYYIKSNNNNNINTYNNTHIIFPDNESQYSQNTDNNYHKKRKSIDLNNYINNNNEGIQLKEKYKEKYEQLNIVPIDNNNKNNVYNPDNISNCSRLSYQMYKDNTNNNKNESKPYFNGGNKTKNRKEIKRLIRLYNMAKDDKKNKNNIDNNNNNNNNAYDIINNNKSVPNYNFNPDNNNNNNNIINENNINNINNIQININENLNNNSKINYNNYYISENLYDNNIDNKSNPDYFKNEFINNYNNFKKINEEEEENSIENDFVKGHRFQIKYEKVKPKGQIYSKISIPKPRTSSVKNISYNENPFNKNEDMVNLGNTYFSNKKEEIDNKQYNNNKQKYNERIKYKMENSERKKINNTNLNSNENLSITGKFSEEINNNINDNNNINNNNNNIKNLIDKNKNITYKESKEKQIISKNEKIDNNNNNITPDKKGKNEEQYIIKVQKKTSEKEYTKYKMIENKNNNKYINDSKSTVGIKKQNNNKLSQKMYMDRKSYNKIIYNNNNNYKNKNNLAIEKGTVKKPNQVKYNNYENGYSNIRMSPSFYNNFSSKTFYTKKKYTPNPYYPYEFTANNNDMNNRSKKMNYENKERLGKKYY